MLDMADRKLSSTRRQFLKLSILSGGMSLLVGCDALRRYEAALNEGMQATQSPSIGTTSHYPAIVDLSNEDDSGERLVISGVVYADDMETPLAGAIITVWHTDTEGEYGRFRSSLQTDENGRYELRTIRPGHYQVEDIIRAAHIHFTVEALGMYAQSGELLFADDPMITTDPVVLEADPDVVAARTLTLSLEQDADGSYYHGKFDIVLRSRRRS